MLKTCFMTVLSALMLLSVAGCLLSSAPYRNVNYYDIGKPVPVSLEGIDLKVEPFVMDAPSMCKMLYRSEKCRIFVDDYNKWIQSPSLMLSVFVENAFNENIKTDISGGLCFTLDGKITVFEIDMDSSESKLGVDYKILRTQDKKVLLQKSSIFSHKFDKISAEVFAAAMSVAASGFVEELKSELLVLRAGELKNAKKKADIASSPGEKGLKNEKTQTGTADKR
ncbi:MAG: hypothetical protein A2017_08460 [Lentisphaerae bacterium GWF2_44_16]|nr:MAG: hypothetical protein A2017_08460 [Lentisphaerae bacterium GWF2_44_16]